RLRNLESHAPRAEVDGACDALGAAHDDLHGDFHVRTRMERRCMRRVGMSDRLSSHQLLPALVLLDATAKFFVCRFFAFWQESLKNGHTTIYRAFSTIEMPDTYLHQTRAR